LSGEYPVGIKNRSCRVNDKKCVRGILEKPERSMITWHGFGAEMFSGGEYSR
jgi:hypothetical protein